MLCGVGGRFGVRKEGDTEKGFRARNHILLVLLMALSVGPLLHELHVERLTVVAVSADSIFFLSRR